jgi:hypothetical protein
MRFFDGFIDEMRKLAADSVSDKDVGQQVTEPTEPDSSQQQSAEPESPAGDLASLDARHKLQDLLQSPDGRVQLRGTYHGLRERIDSMVGVRKAFTRGLLRARREVFGPSAFPRGDLKRILYGDEPYVDVSSA